MPAWCAVREQDRETSLMENEIPLRLRGKLPPPPPSLVWAVACLVWAVASLVSACCFVAAKTRLDKA